VPVMSTLGRTATPRLASCWLDHGECGGPLATVILAAGRGALAGRPGRFASVSIWAGCINTWGMATESSPGNAIRASAIVRRLS
jgi:hypothetical protein